MKRRAHVRRFGLGLWHVCQTRHGVLIPKGCANFATHQEALDAALVAVGLRKPEQHREAP